MLRPALLICLLTAFWAGPGHAMDAPPLFNAEGYRQSHYRSPTPAGVEGARTLDTAQVKALLSQEPRLVLIDTYRRQWLFGQFIDDQPHANLPGSHWLANTGDGVLEPLWQAYFEHHLKRLSQGRKDWPLLFYCRSDCWLGWNAARRAAALGYTRLYWYRDGIDAWQQAGGTLLPATPLPLPDDPAGLLHTE